MKKYKLIDHEGTGLYQIEALINIPMHGVKVGDIGGFIASENNLSHNGNCWVTDMATVRMLASVTDNALVSDNALVTDYSIIKDDAIVKGEAAIRHSSVIADEAIIADEANITGYSRIGGDAIMKGTSSVYGTAMIYSGIWEEAPLQIVGHPYSVQGSGRGLISIGCKTFTVNRWEEDWEEVASEVGRYEKITDKMIEELKIYFNVVKDWLEKYNESENPNKEA